MGTSPAALLRAPSPPSDAEVVRNIEVLAAFVVKNGPQFEEFARAESRANPKFGFLRGGAPNSEAAKAYDYYEWNKQRIKLGIFTDDASDNRQLEICKLVSDDTGLEMGGQTVFSTKEPNKKPESTLLKRDSNNKSEQCDLSHQHQAGTGHFELEKRQVKKREMRPIEKAPESKKHRKLDASPLEAKLDRQKGVSVIKSDLARYVGNAKDGSKDAGKEQILRNDAKATEEKKLFESKRLDNSTHGRMHKVRSPQMEVLNSIHMETQLRGTMGAEIVQEGSEDPGKIKESRGMNLLRTALADYAKEVLKPTWKEGHLSKDAYKNIVKKVVEKVVSTVHGHQIPKSQENVDQYMEQSRVKITKLVQDYVERCKKN